MTNTTKIKNIIVKKEYGNNKAPPFIGGAKIIVLVSHILYIITQKPSEE